MSKEVILTGIRANNDLHIGNYFGALLPTVDMAKNRSEQYQINLFVPDLHSFTTPIDHSQLQAQTMNNLKLFVAAGLPLNNDNVRIYRQSYIPAHSELTWILDCFTGFGQMKRMTQFKDRVTKQTSEINRIRHQITAYMGTIKASEEVVNSSRMDASKKAAMLSNLKHLFKDLEQVMENEFLNASSASVGVFNYPVLMAADILLYGAKYVPVGDDQSQHLEFTRDIAARLNNQFGDLFNVPEPVAKQHEFFGKDQGLRIKDLVDPTKKMSKSDDSGRGIIFLGDSPEEAAAKIMGATTDDFANIAFDVAKQPGIGNLLQIFALLSGDSLETTAKNFGGRTGYGDFKKEIATKVQNFLQDFQGKLAQVDEAEILAKLEKDELAMNKVANQTLLKVQKAVGLR